MSAQADKWQEKVSPLLRQQVAKHRMEARAATRGEQPENYYIGLIAHQNVVLHLKKYL